MLISAVSLSISSVELTLSVKPALAIVAKPRTKISAADFYIIILNHDITKIYCHGHLGQLPGRVEDLFCGKVQLNSAVFVAPLPDSR